MIKPPELDTDDPVGPWGCPGSEVWETLSAAAKGECAKLRRLLAHRRELARAEFDYTQPIHLAVREGHLEALGILLGSGADPKAMNLRGEDLIAIALDRDHLAVARSLAAARGDEPPSRPEHEIHAVAERGDLERAGVLLDGHPELLERRDAQGATPLHRAAAASAESMIGLLLSRGADIHARQGTGPGTERGYASPNFEPIDSALWTGPFWVRRAEIETARRLVEAGASKDLVIASALGDLTAVEALLAADSARIDQARPCGKRALSSAIEGGHDAIARLLLEHGADPNLPEGGTAPRGAALHAAARSGNQAMVELLLAHGADPRGWIDASGSAAYAAKTPEIRSILLAHGASLNPYDWIWLGEEEEALSLVRANPRSAERGCGGALAAACTLGKAQLLADLLAAGARVPSTLTGCRTYLLRDPGMLRSLLASGMDPGLPSWQKVTPLHDLCGRDSRGRPLPRRRACAAILIEAGASLGARDEEYRSTPLAWAAREGLPEMVELLLAHGAPARHPEDRPWATPLAWADRRGHADIARRLRQAGATD